METYLNASPRQLILHFDKKVKFSKGPIENKSAIVHGLLDAIANFT